MPSESTVKLTYAQGLTRQTYDRRGIRSALAEKGFKPEFFDGVFTLKRIPLTQFNALLIMLGHLQKNIDAQFPRKGAIPLRLPFIKELREVNLGALIKDESAMGVIFERAVKLNRSKEVALVDLSLLPGIEKERKECAVC